MRKLNLTAQELQALYPSVSEAFENSVQNTLHNLAEGKEQPAMKRKISAALVVVLALIILTISAAIALTSSNLLTFLFGQEQPPKEVEKIVSNLEATIMTPDIKVTLHEYMYDGEKLYLYWTVTNQAGRQLMVTMDPIQINGRKVNFERDMPFQREYSVFGQILGGKASGATIPESIRCYNILINPREGMSEYYTLKGGEQLDITSNLYIWELLSPPNLIEIDCRDIKEGYLDVASLHGMPTGRNGTCGLGWLLFNDYSIDVYSAEKNQHVYEENNWAKLLYEQPVHFSITLSSSPLKQTKPLETSFVTNDFSLEIKRMVYMSTGGTLVLRVTPKPQGTMTNALLDLGIEFVVLDAESKELISSYTPCTDGLMTYVDYTITLQPVTGDMPKAILLVPVKENPAWNQDPDNIYPNASSPNNNDSYYSFVMEDAVRVELMEQP